MHYRTVYVSQGDRRRFLCFLFVSLNVTSERAILKYEITAPAFAICVKGVGVTSRNSLTFKNE